jgi:hypothetical protein
LEIIELVRYGLENATEEEFNFPPGKTEEAAKAFS